MHSLRIGGATHLSAGGASLEVLQREGLWASDAYKAYVRSHGKDASWVADEMAQEGLSIGVQPGQGTNWGQEPTKRAGRAPVAVASQCSSGSGGDKRKVRRKVGGRCVSHV